MQALQRRSESAKEVQGLRFGGPRTRLESKGQLGSRAKERDALRLLPGSQEAKGIIRSQLEARGREHAFLHSHFWGLGFGV